MYKVIGIVVAVMETKQITEKFAKREFVIEPTGEIYPQKVIFQTVNDKTSMLDAIAEGQQIEVCFNLHGREWTRPETGEIKYFNTLDAWRVEVLENTDYQPPTPSAPETPIKTEAADKDLPF